MAIVAPRRDGSRRVATQKRLDAGIVEVDAASVARQLGRRRAVEDTLIRNPPSRDWRHLDLGEVGGAAARRASNACPFPPERRNPLLVAPGNQPCR